MTMRLVLPVLLALAPVPALASGLTCTITTQCGGGTCEPYPGGPFLIEDMGDSLWRISADGQTWDGYSSTTLDTGGEISIVLPPQQGMSGLVTVYPSGEISFTAHAYGEGPVAITGSGTCAGTGG